MEFRLVSSLEKPGIGPDPERLGPKPLYALGGETISFQLAYREKPSAETQTEARKQEAAMPMAGAQASPKEAWAAKEIGGQGRAVTRFVYGGIAFKAAEDSDQGEGARMPEGPEVRIRRVLPVMCRRSCNPDSVDEDYLFYDARMAPDLLRDMEPGEEIPVTENWQSLWVDVGPGEDRTCEDCRIEFVLEESASGYVLFVNVQKRQASEGDAASEACSGELTGERAMDCVDIRMVKTVLPKLDIPHTEWFHCDGIVNYYGVEAFSEEFWRIFRNLLSIYVKRGANTILTPIVTPPLDTEVGGERTTIQLVDVKLREGGYILSFDHLERFVDICLEEGIEYFEICHLFTQWGATAAPKVTAWKDGRQERIFGWDTPSDDPEYLGFLSVLLPALREYLGKRGLLERTFFHISDEPDIHSEHYQASQRTVRGLLEGCTIVEAVSDYLYYEKGLVDVPVCAVDHIEPFLEKRPPILWSYYCCAQTKDVPNRFISMPSRRNRIYGILLYWHGIEGILHWGFNFYNSMYSKKKIDPYETVDADQGFPAGDPFVVYPGKNGVPEESLRLMVLEEALNDYRALRLLESYVGRDEVLELIRREAGMELSFKRYPRNDKFILELRDKVNRKLTFYSCGQ